MGLRDCIRNIKDLNLTSYHSCYLDDKIIYHTCLGHLKGENNKQRHI